MSKRFLGLVFLGWACLLVGIGIVIGQQAIQGHVDPKHGPVGIIIGLALLIMAHLDRGERQ